ncbi:MAG: hypothetical protein ACOCX1_06395 [Fimbriimonadaceae bacterium]
MTGRELLQNALAGLTVEPKPVIVEEPSPDADGLCVRPGAVAKAVADHPDQLVLVTVDSPYGRAFDECVDVLALLDEDPSRCDDYLRTKLREAENDIAAAKDAGAHGIRYRLAGATTEFLSRPIYSRWLLPLDEMILAEHNWFELNLIEVIGDEPFLDLVAQVPAHVIAWDRKCSRATVDQVKNRFEGLVATADGEGDIFFVREFQDALPWLGAGASL